MNKKILLWVLSLFLLSSFVSAATILYTNQFELTTDCDSTYWTATGSNVMTPIRTSSEKYNGSYSCTNSGTGTGSNSVNHDMNFDGTLDGINVSAWIMRKANDNIDVRYSSDAGYTNQLIIGYNIAQSTTKFSYLDGGWTATGVDFNTDVWYNIQFIRDGNNIKLYVNDNLIHTATRTSIDMSFIHLYAGENTVFFDNFIAYTGNLTPIGQSNFTITANINNFSATLGEEISINPSSEWFCSPFSCFNYTIPIEYYTDTQIQLGDNRYSFDATECTQGDIIEIKKDSDLSSNIYYYCNETLIQAIPNFANQTIGDLYIDRSFQTTTGTIVTNVLSNSTSLYNITLSSDQYYIVEFLNYNVSNNLNYNFPFFQVSAIDNNTGLNISNFDVLIDGNWTYNVTSGLVPIYINQSTVNISVFSDGYLTYSDETHNTSNNLFAQMYPYAVNITFLDINTSLAYSNSSITIYYPSGYSEIKTTDGNGTIFFNAFYNGLNEVGNYIFQANTNIGYITPTNFTATINQSNLPYNNTYEVDRAFINITIRDVQTGNLLTENATVTISGVGQYTTNTGTLIIRDANISAGDYVLTTFIAGYDLNTRNFDYTGLEEQQLTISMVNQTGENIGDWIVTVLDPFYNTFLGADTRLLQYDSVNDVYEEIDSCITNADGRCVYSVEIGIKKYIVTAYGDIGGQTFFAQSSQTGEVIYFDQDTVNLFLNIQPDFYVSPSLNLDVWYYNDTLVNLTGGTENANISYLSAQFLDTDGNSHQVCIDYYYIDGLNKKEATSVCSTGASGIVKVVGGYILDRSYTWITEITLVQSGGDKEVIYSFTYQKEEGAEFQLGIFAKFVIVLIFILMLVISLWIKNILIFGLGTIAIQPFVISVLPSYWDWKITSVIILLSLVLIYLTRKTESLQSV